MSGEDGQLPRQFHQNNKMQRVTITRISVKDGGTPEKPWKKLGIQTKEHGDKWLGAFFNKYNEKELSALKEGVTVDILVTTSDDGKYLNFRLPSELDKVKARLDVVEKKLGIVAEEPAQDDISPDEIPF